MQISFPILLMFMSKSDLPTMPVEMLCQLLANTVSPGERVIKDISAGDLVEEVRRRLDVLATAEMNKPNSPTYVPDR